MLVGSSRELETAASSHSFVAGRLSFLSSACNQPDTLRTDISHCRAFSATCHTSTRTCRTALRGMEELADIASHLLRRESLRYLRPRELLHTRRPRCWMH